MLKTRNFIKTFLFYTLLFAWFLCPNRVSAQGAFEEFHFAVTGNKLISGGTILHSWEPNAGFGFEVNTPYHFGNLEAGYRYVRFDELDFENSGFHSHFVFGGWFYRYPASPEVFVVPGIRLGNRFMLHDEDMFYGDDYRFSREESEFAFEMHFRIEYQFSSVAGFYISTSYNRTVFNIPFSSFVGTIGLTARLDSPDWLKRFLK